MIVALFLLLIGDAGAETGPGPESKVNLGEVQEITVSAPRITNSVESMLEIRKKENNVSEILGRENMGRSGDSDAASSLRRVTGLTLVGGKFVYVRGLGERYSSVLLNGSQLPSPEPTRRVVPLDLFPVSILESITVQKSFSPDRPAEFGGGLIELQTRELPKKITAQVSITMNPDQWEEGISYEGGKKDFLGMDDGTRKMPESIRKAFDSGKKLIVSETEGFSAKEIERMGQNLTNKYNTSTQEGRPIPNLQVMAGNSITLSGVTLGALVGGLYSSERDVGERLSQTFNVGSGGRLERDSQNQISYTEDGVQMTGSAQVGAQFETSDINHKLQLNGLLLRNTTNLTQVTESKRSGDSFEKRQITLLEWDERQLRFAQLTGSHSHDRATINWRVNTSLAEREAPDSREILRNYDQGVYLLETSVNGNKRVFSELTDRAKEVGIDSKIKIFENNKSKLNLKLGGAYSTKKRRSDIYRLHFKNNYAMNDLPDLTQDSETLFSQRGENAFFLTNITDAADSFEGRQTLMSSYGQVEWSPFENLTITTGLRSEKSVFDVETFKYYEPELPTSAGHLVMKDLLPSYTGTFLFTKDHRLKLSYGETIARPDFRELSTVSYIEDETGNDVIGNSALKGTVIRNWDLRFENYFNGTDYYSIGAFYKNFESPIEAIFQPGDKLVKTFTNAKEANNFGLEVEGRLGLRSLTRYLRRWTLASNFSAIESQVKIDDTSGNQTSSERPLQGQSPYVVNFQLLYDRPAYNMTAGAIYNVVGRRITEVGTNSRPDIYEEPFHQLDFVFTQKLKEFSYQLKAKNILDLPLESTQGEEIVRSRKKGRSYSAGITVTL